MHKMIELMYPLNGLEPYYSEETLNIHYNKLYKGYVDNYNKVQAKLENSRKNNEYENIKCLEKDLSFQGSGVILHELFFNNINIPIPSSPNIALLERITIDFKSFENLKKQFSEASKVVEASGWCLLVWDENFNKLEILQCEKHQNLTLWGCIPLLVIDMWEHSYYLQYKSNRQEYIDNFWNIINWNIVNKRYEIISKYKKMIS